MNGCMSPNFGRWVPCAVALLAGCGRGPVELPKATGPMNLEQAKDYVLALVNRDRAREGLEPVERDEVAERAAQRHAEDMSAHGFTAHWGTDGSVPEQRYSEAGGVHMVQENSACFFDGVARKLDPNPTFMAQELEKVELAFVGEVPPNDGHRRNILKGSHTHLGVGLAKPEGIEQPCMAQEFVDQYGDYDPIPAHAAVGQSIRVSGEVFEPLEFGGIGLAKQALPRPMSPSELNQTSVYPIPEPDVVYFPKGYQTPKEVHLDGARFDIELELDRGPGLYEISVWAKFPDSGEALGTSSIRTLRVE